MKLVRLMYRRDMSYHWNADDAVIASMFDQCCRFCCWPRHAELLTGKYWGLVMPTSKSAVLADLPLRVRKVPHFVFVREDLHALLSEHAICIRWSEHSYGASPSAYRLWCQDPNARLLYRDVGTFYDPCVCGQLMGISGHESVVRRSVKPNHVYLDDIRQIIMDRDLWDRLEIGKRYLNLMRVPVRVTDEPEDGETLPGDPGWDGTFRPRFTSVPQRERILEQERRNRRGKRKTKPAG